MNVKLLLSFLFFFASSLHSTEILLIRHGETNWNLEQRVQGRADIPLNEKGIAQAEALAQKIKCYHPDICPVIYTSDLSRAVETAKKTAALFDGYRLVLMPDLREMDWGAIDGMFVAARIEKYHAYEADLKAKYPLRKERWNHPPTDAPGVETFNQLVERTTRALKEIALAHPNEKVAVFAHGRVINQLIIDVQNLETDHLTSLPNCVVAHFLYDPTLEKPLQYIGIEDLINKE